MQDSSKPTRREFSVAAAMAILSGVTIQLTACGGSGTTAPTPAPTPTPPPTGGGGGGGTAIDVNGAVGSNHGHTAVVTGAQLSAGAAVQIQIQGTSDHPHTVDLTAADLTQIQGGTSLTKNSSMDASHTHTVTFN